MSKYSAFFLLIASISLIFSVSLFPKQSFATDKLYKCHADGSGYYVQGNCNSGPPITDCVDEFFQPYTASTGQDCANQLAKFYSRQEYSNDPNVITGSCQEMCFGFACFSSRVDNACTAPGTCANSGFCVNYIYPNPNPTPTPTNTPTPTRTPTPTPTRTPTPTPTPTPACTYRDIVTGNDGYQEACTGLNGTISDKCSTATSYQLAFCHNVTGCYYDTSISCSPGQSCRIKSNGQPECYTPPTPTPSDPCFSSTDCPACTARSSCGWAVVDIGGGEFSSSCRSGTSTCPSGADDWYWFNCSTNQCVAPTSTPTPTPTPTLAPGAPTNTPVPPTNTPVPGATNTPTPTRTPTPTPSCGLTCNGVCWAQSTIDSFCSCGATCNALPSTSFTCDICPTATPTSGPTPTPVTGCRECRANLYTDNACQNFWAQTNRVCDAFTEVEGACYIYDTTKSYERVLCTPCDCPTPTPVYSTPYGTPYSSPYATPTYYISGNVFIDDNKNKLKDSGENNYTALPKSSMEFHIGGGTDPCLSGDLVKTVERDASGKYNSGTDRYPV